MDYFFTNRHREEMKYLWKIQKKKVTAHIVRSLARGIYKGVSDTLRHYERCVVSDPRFKRVGLLHILLMKRLLQVLLFDSWRP